MAILQSRRYQIKGNYQPLDADLTAVAASGLASAWTTYTPTVTPGTGSFTTLGARTGSYLIIGKITFVQLDIGITTNGTAANYVQCSLPSTVKTVATFTGHEANVTGSKLRGNGAGTLINIYTYNALYPGGSGYRLIVFGTYENT